jgi:microcin C transport system permease protein
MTFPRKVGLLLLLVAIFAAVSHYHGLALPSLRWFFSFTATPDQIFEADTQGHLIDWGELRLLPANPRWLRENQGDIIGYSFCGISVVTALCLLVFGGKFQWNPLTLHRLARFRSIGRGWASFRIILVLVGLAMLDQALVGRRALAVNYDGKWYFPAFREAGYSDKHFGGTEEQEVNYRRLRTKFREEKSANRVILAPVPWDPTFDSDEVVKRTLVEIDGKLYRPGNREPYNGQASQFQEGDSALVVRSARFRKGLRDGTTSVHDARGEFAGREEWSQGKLAVSNVTSDAGTIPAGPWIELIYPPAPPSLGDWETTHLLGTDSKGWDIAAQIYGGMQLIFKASVLYIVLTYGIGITIGCLQGYYGSWFDLVAQRVEEVLTNVPFLLIVMILTANIGLDKVTLIRILLIFCIFSWIGVSIYLRTATFREKARDYVAAARVQGAGTTRVIFRHILPNSIATLVTLLPFTIAGLATLLTALDFLGFGLPEKYPSWGRLLDDGTSNLSSPWIVSSVFGMIVSVLLLITFVGEAIREAYDPKKFTTYQ